MFLLAGCSSSDTTSTGEKAAEATTTVKKTAPKKISDDNVFSSQVKALEAAKAAGSAAQQSIDSNQQKLDATKGD